MEQIKHRLPTEHAKINNFAIRCFRDIGDGDYIAARVAIRSRLVSQFLWSSEQAVEKYLKCILMLNRKATHDLSHKIGDALDRINKELSFKILLSAPEQQVFDHLVDWDADRYLIGSFNLMTEEVLNLDRLVWRLRQYCVPLDMAHYADAPSAIVLLENIKRIEEGLLGPAKDGHISHGLLEQILADKKHPARAALIWKNFHYSARQRKSMLFNSDFHAVNTPLFLYPELAVEAAKWMKISKKVLDGCHQLAIKRKKQKMQEEREEREKMKQSAEKH